MKTFVERLEERTNALGRLCVGIDPHPGTLERWGLSDDLGSLERFSRGLVEETAELVAVYKPQSAFFEAHGPAGLEVLAAVLGDIRQAGALSILDVKRGDIGSTMAAYARAYLDDGASLRADAITLNPYLGLEALRPAIDLAEQSGRGLFVLARTSNPEGNSIQEAENLRKTVSQLVVDDANVANSALNSPLIGLVVGATRENIGVNLDGFAGWVLAPGVGTQGGTMDRVPEIFGTASNRVLPSVSREIANSGPGMLQAKIVGLLS
jgi:orotidine-5'-phosphate decarboxylase